MDFGIFDEVNAAAGLTPAEVFEGHLDQVEAADRLGYDSYWRFEDVSLMPPVLQRPTPPIWFAGMSEASVRWAAEHGMPFVTSNVPASYKAYPDMHRRLGAMTLDDLLAERLILFGGPDEVSRGVAELRDRDVDMLMLWVSPRDVALDLVDACIERFARDVMPRFAGAGVSG